MNDSTKSSEKIPNRSMPPGIIIPELIYADLEIVVPWLCDTFGFKERLRIGNHRSQLVFGDASIIAVAKHGEQGSTLPNTTKVTDSVTHSIMVRVENVDRHYERVKQSGTRIINPPNDYPYGERQYTVEDVGGHLWTFSQSIADVDPGEWGGKLIDRSDET